MPDPGIDDTITLEDLWANEPPQDRIGVEDGVTFDSLDWYADWTQEDDRDPNCS